MEYPSIKLTSDEAAKMAKLNAKREANQAFVQQVVTAGERRNEELLTEGRELWAELAKTYSLDLERVAYDFRNGELIASQVRL